jgi:ABC-type spermidine/putrescine transport system permease subunit I
MLVMLPFWTSFLLRVYAVEGAPHRAGPRRRGDRRDGLDRVLAALGLVPGPASS